MGLLGDGLTGGGVQSGDAVGVGMSWMKSGTSGWRRRRSTRKERRKTSALWSVGEGEISGTCCGDD